MRSKARLIKKEDTAAPDLSRVNEQSTVKQDRAAFTYQTIQTTKTWLTKHRKKKSEARQTFAALFIAPDTHSKAA